jgi:hypothetical protein
LLEVIEAVCVAVSFEFCHMCDLSFFIPKVTELEKYATFWSGAMRNV